MRAENRALHQGKSAFGSMDVPASAIVFVLRMVDRTVSVL
jgi:hypothetical protein